MFGRLTSYLLELGLAFTLGFMACLWLDASKAARKEVKAQAKTISESAVAVANAGRVSEKIEATVASKTAVAKRAAKIISETKVVRLKNDETQAGSIPQQGDKVCASNSNDLGDRAVLTVGAVRVLNEARAGIASGSATISDGQSEAASDVGIRDFIQNDIEVVRLYHDLATRHDALVEWVNDELKKQAQR